MHTPFTHVSPGPHAGAHSALVCAAAVRAANAVRKARHHAAAVPRRLLLDVGTMRSTVHESTIGRFVVPTLRR
jgi:hypothetical protein